MQSGNNANEAATHSYTTATQAPLRSVAAKAPFEAIGESLATNTPLPPTFRGGNPCFKVSEPTLASFPINLENEGQKRPKNRFRRTAQVAA